MEHPASGALSVVKALRISSSPADEVFELPEEGELAVVVCHFNPCSYVAPVQNVYAVLRWLRAERLPTYAVELRCGASLNTPPALPPAHRRVLQLTSSSSLFRKDNLWNVAVQLVPRRFQYLLFLDADALLFGEAWKAKLLKELLTTPVVQPFATAFWTDSASAVFKSKPSCGFGYVGRSPDAHVSHKFHSGFAVAVQRRFFDETAGFYNCPIGGGSLFFMSAIMDRMCELEDPLGSISPRLLAHYRQWANEASSWVRGRFGVVEADAVHLWHGSRQKRRYLDRFQRLRDFDPWTDIESRSPHGVHEWTASALAVKSEMVRAVEEYFLLREEDEVYLSAPG